jgi:hypothetical protein
MTAHVTYTYLVYDVGVASCTVGCSNQLDSKIETKSLVHDDMERIRRGHASLFCEPGGTVYVVCRLHTCTVWCEQ